MSLANKYRPENFDTIVAQNHITDILKAQMKSDQKIHHNYLFFGPRWTWKTSAARILARALNCLNPTDGNPCNTCANCTTIREGKTLDYVEIDAASHTGVDNIREEILDKAVYPPTQLKKKIYVIDEVHMLSKWAFNALLKTIEEPKDNVCFILATTEIHKVPETIISRCQVFNFKKILGNDMIVLLKEICNAEWLGYDDSALNLIAKISEWCARDAIKYIDQVSVFGDVNEENVTKFLGVASESMIKDFLDLIKSKDRNSIFEKIDEIHNKWIDLVQFAKQNIMYIDQNLMTDTDFLLDISEAFSEIISTVKYYPYPTMIYKVALNRYIRKGKNVEVSKSIKDIDYIAKPIATTVVEESKNIQKDIELEVTVNDKNLELVNETKQENVVVWNKDIMKSLIASVESKTLKDSLENYTIIKNINGSEINLIVINKIAELSLKNENTKKMIESTLSKIVWRPLKLSVEFQNKEDYFASQM